MKAFVTITAFLCLFKVTAWSQIKTEDNNSVTIIGQVTKLDGSSYIDGKYDVVVNFYASAKDLKPLWSKAITGALIQKGDLTMSFLKTEMPEKLKDQTLFVEVQVGKEPPQVQRPLVNFNQTSVNPGTYNQASSIYNVQFIPNLTSITPELLTKNQNVTLPRQIGSVETGHSPSGICVSGGIALIISSVGLQIVNVSDPARPVFLSTIDLPGRSTVPVAVARQGNYAYAIANYYSSTTEHGILYCIDLSDLRNPRIVSTTTLMGLTQSLQITGNYAFVGARFGIFIYNIENPEGPILRRRYSSPPPGQTAFDYCRDLALQGSALFALLECSGRRFLLSLDISNPETPDLIDHAEVSVYSWYMHCSNNVLILLIPQLGFTDVYDVGASGRLNFASRLPRQTAYESSTGVVHRGRCYVAYLGSTQQIEISDIRRPSSATHIGNIDLVDPPDYSSAHIYIAADGDYLYVVAMDSHSLHVFDLN